MINLPVSSPVNQPGMLLQQRLKLVLQLFRLLALCLAFLVGSDRSWRRICP